MNNKTKGYLLGVVAASTYGMIPLFTLPLYADGMDVYSVLFFRYLFSLPILAAMLKLRGRSFSLTRPQLLGMMILGMLIATSSVTLFSSYLYMEAGIASTILFIYPIMVVVIMSIFYKERINLTTVLCMLAAGVGISLLYHGEGEMHLSTTGTLLVVTSALAYALYIVGVNHPHIKGVATLKVTFYVLLFGITAFVVITRFGRNLTLPSNPLLWGNLLALAVLPTIVSFACTTLAVQYICSTPTAILGALEPLTAVLIGLTVFGEQLTPRLALGMTLIIVAVVIIVGGGHFSAYLVHFRKLFPRLRRLKKTP